MSCQKRRSKKKEKKNEKQLTCHRSRNPRRVCSRTGAEPQRRTPTPLTSLNKTQRKHTQLTLLLASTGFLYLFSRHDRGTLFSQRRHVDSTQRALKAAPCVCLRARGRSVF